MSQPFVLLNVSNRDFLKRKQKCDPDEDSSRKSRTHFLSLYQPRGIGNNLG